MLLPRPSLCFFCESRLLLKPLCSPLWQQSVRFAGGAKPKLWKERRRLERKAERVERRLSKASARNPKSRILQTKEVVGRSRPARESQRSPWAATNQTEARIHPGLRTSRADQKRKDHKLKRDDDSKGGRKEGEYKALRMQQSLTRIGYGLRNTVKKRISDVEDFDQFPILPSLKEAVKSQALKGVAEIAPTPIQKLAIPALLGTDTRSKRQKVEGQSSKEFLLAAETGSGKTLAYLLPVIDALKRSEEEAQAQDEAMKATQEAERERKQGVFELDPPETNESHPTTGRPRAIILLPTAELVDQVGAVTKAMAHVVKYRSAFISSSYSGVVIRKRLFSPGGIDILISTPHLLSSITESDPNVLSKVNYLVIDEADSLLDTSFRQSTTAILDRATPSLKQLIMCSATIPKWLDTYCRKRYPEMRRLATPNLHAIPRRVQLGVVDVERDHYHGNKNLACADAIWSIGRSATEYDPDEGKEVKSNVKRILVFVNEREKTTELAEYLQTRGIDAAALNRDADVRKNENVLAEFTGQEIPEQSKATAPANKGKMLPNTKVLVVTDLASRGIDTTAVKHVILYDVPHTTIDFIHRLGRTGRMNRRGRGIVLVGKKDRKDIVREVREGMFRGQALI